jgi:hypothetical protein
MMGRERWRGGEVERWRGGVVEWWRWRCFFAKEWRAREWFDSELMGEWESHEPRMIR